MTERDDSRALPALRSRLEAARQRLAGLWVSSSGATGPTDPSTGESWHRGNVLGHMSEMLAYWSVQIQAAAAGSGKMGRDQEGAANRRQGIDHGNAADEAELRRGVDQRIGDVLLVLEGLTPDDLERTVVFHNREGSREARIGELTQMLVVGHLEEHLAQLASLG